MDLSLLEFNLNLATIVVILVGIVWILKQYTRFVVWYMKNIYTDKDDDFELSKVKADTDEK